MGWMGCGYGAVKPRWGGFTCVAGGGNEEGGVCRGVRFVERASAFERGVGNRDCEFEAGLDSDACWEAGGWLETCWKARCGSYFSLVGGGVGTFSLLLAVSPSSDFRSLIEDGICGGGSSAMSFREFLVICASAPEEPLFHAAFSDGSSGNSSVTVRLSGDLPQVPIVCGGVPMGEIEFDCEAVSVCRGVGWINNKCLQMPDCILYSAPTSLWVTLPTPQEGLVDLGLLLPVLPVAIRVRPTPLICLAIDY